LSRSNLVVWPGTLVRRLTFTGARASGVECVRQGAAVRPVARRGIVLAAGVIDSPKLLMLSGIGPADALRKVGVPVRLDVPQVGLNLHDHPRVGVRWAGRTKLPASSVSAGLLTWSSGASMPTPPDIQFYVGRGIDTPDPFITLTVAVSQPRSRGSIALRSADPASPPRISANYYQDPRDLDAMLRAVRLAIEIANTPPYEPLRGAPADQEIAAPTDANLRTYIRRTSDTIFHPVGSCRMGSDAGSVVDPQLRVRGVDGLWIADSSVMPETVNCQTLAASLMIAERGAEFMT
jgi:choline dehydrogenase